MSPGAGPRCLLATVLCVSVPALGNWGAMPGYVGAGHSNSGLCGCMMGTFTSCAVSPVWLYPARSPFSLPPPPIVSVLWVLQEITEHAELW